MMSTMKSCLLNLRSRFTALSSRCSRATNSQISSVSASCSRNFHLASSTQAIKLRETDCTSRSYPSLIPARRFHVLQQEFPIHSQVGPASPSLYPRNLLALAPPGIMHQVRTFKVKMSLRKRCKDCYFTKVLGQLMVLCKTHPRHKQRQCMPHRRSVWILTHATQGRIRPW